MLIETAIIITVIIIIIIVIDSSIAVIITIIIIVVAVVMKFQVPFGFLEEKKIAVGESCAARVLQCNNELLPISLLQFRIQLCSITCVSALLTTAACADVVQSPRRSPR